jgi:hypothetical protein
VCDLDLDGEVPPGSERSRVVVAGDVRLGRVVLDLGGDAVRVTDVRHEVVADDWPSDPAVLDELAACERDLRDWLDEPVGELAEAAPWQELYDSGIARLMAQALVAAYPGDVGLQIAGEPVDDDRRYRVTASDLELSTYGLMIEIALPDLEVHTPAILPELLESYLRGNGGREAGSLL